MDDGAGNDNNDKHGISNTDNDELKALKAMAEKASQMAKTSKDPMREMVTASLGSLSAGSSRNKACQIHYLHTKSKHAIVMIVRASSNTEPFLVPLKDYMGKHERHFFTKMEFVGFYSLLDPTDPSKIWMSKTKTGSYPRTAFVFKIPVKRHSKEGSQKHAKIVANTLRVILTSHLKQEYKFEENWKLGMDLTPPKPQPLAHYIGFDAMGAVMCKTFGVTDWKFILSNKCVMSLYFGKKDLDKNIAKFKSIVGADSSLADQEEEAELEKLKMEEDV